MPFSNCCISTLATMYDRSSRNNRYWTAREYRSAVGQAADVGSTTQQYLSLRERCCDTPVRLAAVNCQELVIRSEELTHLG